MSSMLEVSIGKKASLVRALAPDLPMLLGDATQIRQVVMNLVLNASEALTGAEKTIRVSTGVGMYGTEAFARSAAGGEPKAGTYVYVEVDDEGVGMDAATIAQMFDPFFTTKFVGRGLGMAAVLGIVRGHGGAIDVDSTPRKGTRIRVLFPSASLEKPTASVQPAVDLPGKGVVLVVNDEKNVLVSTQILLERNGFEVLVARDGVEALATFRAQRDRIGAVLLDRTMPRMDGVETMQDLRRIAPDVPVVLTSGYAAVPSDAGQEVQPDAVLAKPYRAEHLLATLQDVMRIRRRTQSA
jgi:CheY-like chemotaxis protein